MKPNQVTTVDQYIAQFPQSTQAKLTQLRKLIMQSAPAAQEVISYQMPGYKLQGMLVYFAGYTKHIGFYPGSSGIAAFKKEIEKYKWAKGSVQFPLTDALPIQLIKRITAFRVKENLFKAATKGKRMECIHGHVFYKNSYCKVCPQCEENKTKTKQHFSSLSAPARRALKNAGINTLKQLAAYSEKELLALHGIGPSSIPRIREIVSIH